jgi:hypothetical protein
MAPRKKTNAVSTKKATAPGVSKTTANSKINSSSSTTTKATASGLSKTTANIKTRSMTLKAATKSKGKKPSGITKKSILRAPTAAGTHKMATRSKKSVHFAETLKTTAYFASESTTPTMVPPPPPRLPNPNKRVFYLPKEHMEAFRERYEAVENPEDFDWKWVEANMVQLSLGKTGPKGCIKLEIILPEELGFLVFPGEIKVVDTEPYNKRAGGVGGEKEQPQEEGSDAAMEAMEWAL